MWAVNVGWQLGEESLVMLRCAIGDENSVNPIRDLIGNDHLQSYGLDVRLGWRHAWSFQPAYRYEIHERFNLHALSATVIARY